MGLAAALLLLLLTGLLLLGHWYRFYLSKEKYFFQKSIHFLFKRNS
jgi:hypothetical protein